MWYRHGELDWFRTRGPNGHIRVLAESVEGCRQGGQASSHPSSGGALVAVKRDSVQALRAELDERKLKRELRQLEAEDVAATRAEELVHRRALEESRLQAARDAERRATERRQASF